MMRNMLKMSVAILLGGVLVLSGCSSKETNEPLPDSVIASVPTVTPTFTPTPTPIKPIEESVAESYEESMPEDTHDDMDSEVDDDWDQDDGDAEDYEEQSGPEEPHEIGIVEDDEFTDQGAEGNKATATEIADVYSEPGGDPDTIIGTIDAGDRVTIQGNVDGWFVINYEGTRAYVNADLFA